MYSKIGLELCHLYTFHEGLKIGQSHEDDYNSTTNTESLIQLCLQTTTNDFEGSWIFSSFTQKVTESDHCYLTVIRSNAGKFVSLSIGWRGLINQPDGERTDRKERIQGKFCCTIFKVFIIRLYLTRGLSLMKLLFSLTLCSHLPKCLFSISLPSSSISLFFSVLCTLPLPLCLSALFISVHFCFIFDGSFSLPLLPSSHPTSHLSVLLSPPRWIIAQRTVQRTQVQIMSLPRGRSCLSLERPSKVKTTVTATIRDIFSKNMSLRLRLKWQRSSAAPEADVFFSPGFNKIHDLSFIIKMILSCDIN